MSQTRISNAQTDDTIYSTDTLVAGNGISIVEDTTLYDANTLAVYHFDEDKNNVITGNAFGTSPAVGNLSATGAKWDKGFSWSSGEFFVNNQTSAIGTTDFTVDFWLCPTANNSASTWHIIRMVNWDSSASDNGFAFTVANNTVTVQPYIAASRVTTVQKTFDYQVPHHFAIERVSDRTFNLYIDGILFHTATASQFSLNYNRFGVGQTSWNANITIDELRVSNVARYNGSNFDVPTHPYGYVEKKKYLLNNTVLTSIQGYNASSTQVLWNNRGTLKWVDTTYQGGN